MGNCACGRGNGQSEESFNNGKNDVLAFITRSLGEMEEYLVKLRKEDVNYKMTKLIFFLNVMNEIKPIVRAVEDIANVQDENDFNYVKSLFENIFANVYKYERDKCYEYIKLLEDFLKIKK